MDIIWNLNQFKIKYKLESKWELSVPVNKLFVHVHLCLQIYSAYMLNVINTYAEHTKEIFCWRGIQKNTPEITGECLTLSSH